MSVPFEFYLRGSDTFFDVTGTTVPTGAADSAPTTIAGPPSTTTGWVTVEAYGADPTLTNEGEEWTSGSGGAYRDSFPRWTFNVVTRAYRFPDDFTAYTALMQHLAKRYLYLAVKTYDVTLHGTNECIPVVCDFSVEHDYDYGKKVTLSLKHRIQTDQL